MRSTTKVATAWRCAATGVCALARVRAVARGALSPRCQQVRWTVAGNTELPRGPVDAHRWRPIPDGASREIRVARWICKKRGEHLKLGASEPDSIAAEVKPRAPPHDRQSRPDRSNALIAWCGAISSTSPARGSATVTNANLLGFARFEIQLPFAGS